MRARRQGRAARWGLAAPHRRSGRAAVAPQPPCTCGKKGRVRGKDTQLRRTHLRRLRKRKKDPRVPAGHALAGGCLRDLNEPAVHAVLRANEADLRLARLLREVANVAILVHAAVVGEAAALEGEVLQRRRPQRQRGVCRLGLELWAGGWRIKCKRMSGAGKGSARKGAPCDRIATTARR